MAKKTKLELTWIGKDDRPRPEPRILLEDPARSHHAAANVTGHDRFDNRLVHGDNLLALKALAQEFAGKAKCVYIDPPFNTQQALEYFDDGIEHSLWLSLVRDRLEILRSLLHPEGLIVVHIDDNELGYLIVLLDEVFGRSNRVSVVTFKQGSATGHKAINPGCVTTSNFLLIYAREKSRMTLNRVFTARSRDARYGNFIVNRADNHSEWKFTTLAKAFASSVNLSERDARKLEDYEDQLDAFVIEHADSVIQPARPDYNAISNEARRVIDDSRRAPGKVFRLERDQHSDMYIVDGKRLLFYRDKLKLVDGKWVAGEPLTTIWGDILSNNLHKEGGVEFPKSKKPEGLIKRVLELTTNPGDLVLDSFAGSGTTGAVAHKMGRRWIMIELGEHAHTHIVPRLRKVIDGDDPGGVTEATGWKGGGGFRYYTLAPSLLERDRWGNWVVSREYDAGMLAEAVCRHEGFTYAPSPDRYWQHGHSTERDFLWVTTQTLTAAQLDLLSEEVGGERTLLVCCGAWRGAADRWPNLTLKKIPQAVLGRCEWGRDDYSLRVAALPETPRDGDGSANGNGAPAAAPAPRRRGRRAAPNENLDAFAAAEGDDP